VSQEESEHNEVDGMKKGVDSKGEVMHWIPTCPIFTWDELVSGANWQWGELTVDPFKYSLQVVL